MSGQRLTVVTDTAEQELLDRWELVIRLAAAQAVIAAVDKAPSSEAAVMRLASDIVRQILYPLKYSGEQR